jgi:hypothetical protein
MARAERGSLALRMTCRSGRFQQRNHDVRRNARATARLQRWAYCTDEPAHKEDKMEFLLISIVGVVIAYCLIFYDDDRDYRTIKRWEDYHKKLTAKELDKEQS